MTEQSNLGLKESVTDNSHLSQIFYQSLVQVSYQSILGWSFEQKLLVFWTEAVSCA
jgi:hypothetical protein